MGAKTDVPEMTVAVDVKEAVRRQRLVRALRDPDVLEDLLVDPEGVAGRYEVSLSDREMNAIHRAGRFVSEWDRRLGGGRWLEETLDRRERRRPRASSLDEAVDRAVRVQIADELAEELPQAIRLATDRVGGDALVRRDRPEAELPVRLRPLARALREITDRVRGEVVREVERVALVETLAARRAAARAAVERDSAPAPAPAFEYRSAVAELGRRIDELVTRAMAEAVERVRPAVDARPAYELSYDARLAPADENAPALTPRA